MVNMKNIYKILVFFSLILIAHSCEDIVEGINENPNDLTLSDVEERLFLTGGELANIQLQCGHLNRVSGCLLYTSPSPRDRTRSRMPSSA